MSENKELQLENKNSSKTLDKTSNNDARIFNENPEIKIDIPAQKYKSSIPEIKITQLELQTSPENSEDTVRKLTKFDTVAEKIRNDLIAPSFYKDVKCGLCSRTFWKVMGHTTDTVAKILVGAATVLTFSSGFYNLSSLAFASGATGTVSMVLSGFAVYALRQANARTEEINLTLQNVGLSNINSNTVEPSNKQESK